MSRIRDAWMMTVLGFATIGTMLGFGVARAAEPAGPRARAAEALRQARAKPKADRPDPAALLRGYETVCRQAIEWVGPGAEASRRLQGALQTAKSASAEDLATAVKTLAATMDEVAEDLAFKPLSEAERPKGFPEYTPVGEVEIRHYPAYRMARTKTTSNTAFWTLFQHIKKNEIAMTAPVQMEYRSGTSGGGREESMAFLYADPSLGRAGAEGSVEVVDVPETTVVSTGVRGARTAQNLAAARARLDRWLKENQARYPSAGDLRVMAHNSPFVPSQRQYFEVQIPVRTAGR